VALSVASLFLTFYVPWIRDSLFHQDTPTVPGWALAVGVTVLFLCLSEVYKVIKRFTRRYVRRRRAEKKKQVQQSNNHDSVDL
jgi:hypothetical protein